MLSIKWDITYRCNLMCGHCINGDYLSKNDKELKLEEMIEIIEKINKDIPVGYVHFLGGEPLVHPEFINFLEYLENTSIKFGFNTNGILLNENNFERLAKLKNLTNIVLSMEGPNEKMNDEIRGKKIFNLIIRRLRMIAEYKEKNVGCDIKIIVNTVLTALNYKSISDMIDLCVKEKVNSLQLLEFIEDGNGVGKNYSLNDEMFLETVKIIAERYTIGCDSLEIVPKFARPLVKDYVEKNLQLKFPLAIHGCGAGATTLFLDNKGFIYPCDRNRKYCETKQSLLSSDFFEVWESEQFKTPFSRYYGDELYASVEPCNQCKYLGDICFPCHLGLKLNEHSVMTKCKLINNLMNQREA